MLFFIHQWVVNAYSFSSLIYNYEIALELHFISMHVIINRICKELGEGEGGGGGGGGGRERERERD